ncbi:MAG: Enoyl-CoA hydratase [uncultured Thermomicrobiales bacterium]|uniref:Enoyl-CoA hydratase n=1 Tax=uncultured Thermomicrobiales bacterium TaxID=1645740 RepID=A0A6J4V551_9BACT|nr:MAG: Enoyl-CoA hydratase [uncultured Thermomicrobiales bacterium]
MAVNIERNEGVATVTLNRPEALNAFDVAQLERLLATLRELRDDRAVRCVIVTGAGEKAFAAGADIKEMAELSPQAGLAHGRLGHAVADALEGLPQPTIAAVNGYAFGGGCELALACDLRLAAANAQFAQPEVTLGIPPGWGATQRLPRLVGPGVAAELIFTGRRVAADEALRLGLVNAIHPARLLPEATALARRIAANSPTALRAAKRALSRAFAGDPAVGLATELALFGQAFGTEDQREGMRAFIEKRPAVFSGE